MNLVLIIAVIVSCLMAIYLGKRLQVWLTLKLKGIGWLIYWIVILATCSLLIVSRLFHDFSNYWLPLFGNIIFGIVICAIYVLIIFDIIRLLSLKIFKPNLVTKVLYLIGVVSLFIYGHEMATRPVITHYQVNINKPAKVDHLRLVQLSDIHISDVTPPEFIQQMVSDVNALDADFIFITGDTIDSRLKPFIDKSFDKQLENLKSKYGTYIIFGNHEYINSRSENNSEDDISNAYQAANMHVLKDDVLYNGNLGITLVGRDDLSVKNYGMERASLSDLLTFADLSRPIILLDHQPKNLEEAENSGVDLMLSGHTHGGQVFPINLLVEYMYKNSYGLYQDLKHHFTSIVSSGYGLWGPPIRLMTRSEIVVIDVTFSKQAIPRSNSAK